MLCGGKKRARSKEDQAQVKSSIVEAARKAIAQDGPEKLSMRKVAKMAGCSAGTIYLYFADRVEMLREVWRDDFEKLEHKLDDAVDCEDNPVCQARALLKNFARYWLERPDQFSVVYLSGVKAPAKKANAADPCLLGGCEDGTGEPVQRLQQKLLELICEARLAGRFGAQCQSMTDETGITDEDRMIADTLMAGVHGVISLHIGAPDYPWTKAEAMVDRMVDTMLFAFTNQNKAA